MGLTGSLLLIAIGAILRFAVDVTTDGFNLHTIGVILMIVGAVGFLLSLIFWSSWGGFQREVVHESGPRRRVIEEDL